MFDLIAELKSLRLYGMADCYNELASQDTAALQSAQWLVKQLVRAEGTHRAVRSVSYPMHAAKFPIHRDLASFDFNESKVDRALIDKLANLSFTDDAHNLVFIGGTGTGKSQVSIALRG